MGDTKQNVRNLPRDRFHRFHLKLTIGIWSLRYKWLNAVFCFLVNVTASQ